MVLKQEAATRLGGGFLSLQRSQRPRLRQDVKRIILSLLDSFPHKSFACGERRPAKQKQIASGRRRCAGASGLFIRFRELPKTPRHFSILIRSDSRLARRMALLYGIRSEPKTALFGSRPLRNANGRVPRFAEKGDWRLPPA